MDVRGYQPVVPSRGHNQIITPRSVESLGTALRAIGLAQPLGNAWPAANLTFYIPFHVLAPFTIVEVAWENGTGASAGNVDLGIYDEAGTRLCQLGATARGAASTLITTTTFTDYTLSAPGLYYMAMAHTATNSILAWTPAPVLCQALGVMEEATGTLPATATFAATTRTYIPNFAFLAKSTAL